MHMDRWVEDDYAKNFIEFIALKKIVSVLKKEHWIYTLTIIIF